jgi:hypothetical protein
MWYNMIDQFTIDCKTGTSNVFQYKISVRTAWYSAVQDGGTLQERIALRMFIFFEPYLVEQERMANVQLLMYGSKHLEQIFFF